MKHNTAFVVYLLSFDKYFIIYLFIIIFCCDVFGYCWSSIIIRYAISYCQWSALFLWLSESFIHQFVFFSDCPFDTCIHDWKLSRVFCTTILIDWWDWYSLLFIKHKKISIFFDNLLSSTCKSVSYYEVGLSESVVARITTKTRKRTINSSSRARSTTWTFHFELFSQQKENLVN